LGFYQDVGHGFGAGATARAGVVGVDGWPRGNLPRLRQLAPMVGAELSGVVEVGHWWGHAVALEPRIGYNVARIDGVMVGLPSIGLSLLSRLDMP